MNSSISESFRKATPVDLNISGVKGGTRVSASAVDFTTGVKAENRRNVLTTVSGAKDEYRIHGPAPISSAEDNSRMGDPIVLSPMEQKKMKSKLATSIKELKAQFSDSESTSPEPEDVPGSSRCSRWVVCLNYHPYHLQPSLWLATCSEQK